jgi:hypothetical protein
MVSSREFVTMRAAVGVGFAILWLGAVYQTKVNGQDRSPARVEEAAPVAVGPVAVGPVEATLQLAVFQCDVTIPLGHRCMGLLPTKSQRIADPLEARGVVLLGSGQPIVLVAVDWCEIRNGAYDAWRDALASAVGTSRQRVLVAALHQHDAPVVDSGAALLLREAGLAGELYDEAFHAEVLERVAAAAQQALAGARPISAIGVGRARVERIASNRRMVAEDGTVNFGRGSSGGGDAAMAAAPEGEVDPWLRTIAFLDGEEVVCELHSYATHPMSYYGRGEVTSDFVGLARARRQADTPATHQIYFSGCSGDVTAGKYNDGSVEAREQLTTRLYEAMVRSHQSLETHAVSRAVERTHPLRLEYHPNPDLTQENLATILADAERTVIQRIHAAMSLSSRQRVADDQPIDLTCIDLGEAQIVLFPGEAFVGYQLLAAELRPDAFVFPIGYGECWPGYIPLERSFADGFADTWLWTAPGAEQQICAGLEKILR